MTAIKTTAASSVSGAEASCRDGFQRPSRRPSPIPSSKTEAEAKSRFVSALSMGVDTLLERGRGRERASAELLSEIADGCSPVEDEIFQTMELLGLSLEDATKVMTVSSAFRKAQTTKGGSTIGAMDELTSRLNLAKLSNCKGRSRSPSPSPSGAPAPPTPRLTELAQNESAQSFQTRQNTTSGAMAKKGQRPTRAKNHQQGRGRKRALAEKTPEKRDNNIIAEDAQTKPSAAAVDLAKEKMLNAKLSKADGQTSKSLARAKSPEGGLCARGKRAAAPMHAEETPSNKRPRTRSQSEDSIPAI